MSQRETLATLGISRSTWHYRHKPRSRVAEPIPQSQRHQPHALSAGETAVITGHVHDAWKDGNSVDFAFAAAWDLGVMVGSRRSWWRIAAALEQSLRPVAPHRKKNGPRVKPVLLATRPNQVWSWDITDFKGLYRGHVFKVYSIMDIFSRKIVGGRVEMREADVMAAEMFEAAFISEGAKPEWAHADSGSSMKSDAVREVYDKHGIGESHSRPMVSNDNPYSESEFRTLKSRQHFPGMFESLEQAREYVTNYIDWYNNHHRHSGINLYTPQQVHDGSWQVAHIRRQESVDAYYELNPGRFRGNAPTVKPAPSWSGINYVEPDPATV